MPFDGSNHQGNFISPTGPRPCTRQLLEYFGCWSPDRVHVLSHAVFSVVPFGVFFFGRCCMGRCGWVVDEHPSKVE